MNNKLLNTVGSRLTNGSTYECIDLHSHRNIWTRLTNLDSSYELFFSLFLKLSHLRLKGKKKKYPPVVAEGGIAASH